MIGTEMILASHLNRTVDPQQLPSNVHASIFKCPSEYFTTGVMTKDGQILIHSKEEQVASSTSDKRQYPSQGENPTAKTELKLIDVEHQTSHSLLEEPALDRGSPRVTEFSSPFVLENQFYEAIHSNLRSREYLEQAPKMAAQVDR